jgi:hypothetical protein
MMNVNDPPNQAELGRTKHSSTPAEHLQHLLNLGWSTTSPLIKKYVRENNLQRVLDEWLKKQTTDN